MKKVLAVSVVVLGLFLGSTALADTADPGDRCEHKSSGSRHKLLGELPAEKEMLFHRTMREAREKKAAIREQIVKAREEAESVLLAPEFNETLFKTKTTHVFELIQREHQITQDAIAALAKQFTPDERKILAELVAKPGAHRRWSSHRQML